MNTKRHNKNREIFAKRLKILRKSNHLTQAELSEKIGIGRGVIAYYESCAKNPTIDTLQKFADFFGVPVSNLLEEPEKTGHRGPISQLEKQLEQIKKLPTTKQKMISHMLEGALHS